MGWVHTGRGLLDLREVLKIYEVWPWSEGRLLVKCDLSCFVGLSKVPRSTIRNDLAAAQAGALVLTGQLT